MLPNKKDFIESNTADYELQVKLLDARIAGNQTLIDQLEIQKKLNDPENMALLRDVLAKLG